MKPTTVWKTTLLAQPRVKGVAMRRAGKAGQTGLDEALECPTMYWDDDMQAYQVSTDVDVWAEYTYGPVYHAI